MANFKAVGRICGNPLNGLCERMCIRADCIIDGCQSRRNGETAVLTLTDFTGGVAPPYTFLRACAGRTTAFTVQETCNAGCNCCRVRGIMQIPVTVQYRDANGTCGCAHGTFDVSRDFTLRTPSPAVADYRFEGEATVVCTTGTFLTDNAVSVTYCIVETYKTVIRADILVPTYGFAVYPACEKCDDCSALLNSALFPET